MVILGWVFFFLFLSFVLGTKWGFNSGPLYFLKEYFFARKRRAKHSRERKEHELGKR
jgi:hypothetical protein